MNVNPVNNSVNCRGRLIVHTKDGEWANMDTKDVKSIMKYGINYKKGNDIATAEPLVSQEKVLSAYTAASQNPKLEVWV